MEIFLIILISILIGVFVIDIILGFISGILDGKRQAELELRLRSIEDLLSDCSNSCQAIGFNTGCDNEYIE